jgi:cytochrome c peroxidase
MTRKPIRVLAAVAAIVVAGFAVAALSRDDQPRAALVDTNHGKVKVAKGDMQRILNAVDATTAGTSNDELVAQGRKVFRDTSLFENGESCQTCHAEGSASAKTGTMVHDTQADQASLPAVPNDFDGPRDPPSLFGIAKTPPYFWIGDVPTLQAAVLRPVLGHMATFVPGGRGKPASEPLDCQSVGSDGERSADCLKRAGELAAQLVAYLKTLDPPATAFDQGTTADPELRKKQLAGEKLFQGKGGCIECHGGPLFTDNLEHNTGVPQVPRPRREAAPDPARVHGADAGCRLRRAARHRPGLPGREHRGDAAHADGAVLGVHQHPGDARPEEHRAVHAQRRLRQPHGGRELLQQGLGALAAEPHDGRGLRPRGLPRVPIARSLRWRALSPPAGTTGRRRCRRRPSAPSAACRRSPSSSTASG